MTSRKKATKKSARTSTSSKKSVTPEEKKAAAPKKPTARKKAAATKPAPSKPAAKKSAKKASSKAAKPTLAKKSGTTKQGKTEPSMTAKKASPKKAAPKKAAPKKAAPPKAAAKKAAAPPKATAKKAAAPPKATAKKPLAPQKATPRKKAAPQQTAPPAKAPPPVNGKKLSKSEMLKKLLATRAEGTKETSKAAAKEARQGTERPIPTSVAKAAEFAATRKLSSIVQKSKAAKEKQKSSEQAPAPKVAPKKKKRRKPPYTKTELKELGQILESERQRLLRDLDLINDLATSNEESMSNSFSNHQADAATDSWSLESTFVARRYEEERLQDVVRALERLEDGTYGLCAMCEDEPQKLCESCPYIPVPRLRAKPFAKLCVPCRTQLEKKKR